MGNDDSNTTRFPSATYCKYNYDHVFKSLSDREIHENECPDKEEYEEKF